MTDKYVERFESMRPSLVRFTKKLEILIQDLLAEERVSVHLIESRTKDISSFHSKITRATKSYIDPFKEVTDLCGIRIIAYYEDQVDQIEKIIRSEFSVDEENSLIHKNNGAEFGYKSSHFIIKLNESRSNLKEWNGSSEFIAEIQVRTVLQHAWAAISHKLQYKKETDVPQALKRKLFRLSALFELADDEFISLRNASSELRIEIENQLEKGNTDLPLDINSLEKVLETSPYSKDILKYAEKAGFVLGENYTEDLENIDLGSLLSISIKSGYKTAADYFNFLEDSVKWCSSYLIEQFNANPGDWSVSLPFICQLLVLHKNFEKFTVDDLIKLNYDQYIAEIALRVAGSFKSHQ